MNNNYKENRAWFEANGIVLNSYRAQQLVFCVWHPNSRTPSLSINLESGQYFCHNPDCGKKGSANRG